MKVFGSTTMIKLLILQVLTICIFSGQRSMLVTQTLEKQTDYFTYFGKLVKQIRDASVCVTSRTDVRVSRSWHLEKQLMKLRFLVTRDLEYYLNQDPMRKRCLQTRLCQYQLTTRFSSNPYKTVWIDQKQS